MAERSLLLPFTDVQWFPSAPEVYSMQITYRGTLSGSLE
jgi:hypothetical protein